MQKKSSIEAALEFSAKQSLFTFEDTGEKCYRDFIEVLENVLQWRRIPYRKKSKVEKKKLPPKEIPRFIAALNEGDIDFTELSGEQWVNHFEGVSQLTTKQGLCDLTRDFTAFQSHPDDIVPRCYNLGDAMQRDEFIDDFRITSAVNMMKLYIMERYDSLQPSEGANRRKNLPIIDPSSSAFQNALYALQWEIRVKIYGEWPEVDISKYFKDKEIPLTDKEWAEVTEKAYECARYIRDDETSILGKILGYESCDISTDVKSKMHKAFMSLDYRILELLRLYASIHPQFSMDGIRNIWIVKSPDSSCGIGMRISYRLEEILEVERGMSGRVVQKYNEIPLLAPVSRQSTLQTWKQVHKGQSINSQSWAKCKFDLRVWVVITTLSPKVQAYIYPVVYGRRCSTPYTNDVQTLTEHFTHLTNYSLQKKATNTNTTAATAAEDNNSSKKSKLRKMCKDARLPQPPPIAKDNDPSGKINEEELLIRFDELQQIFQLHYLQQKQQQQLPFELAKLNNEGQIEEIWRDYLFPMIKTKVMTILQSFAMHESVKPRPNSYEFLGVDVLIDSYFDARILEVNMSPAMAHRTPEQSNIIRLMAQQLMAQFIIPHLESSCKRDFEEWIDNEEAAFTEALPWQNWQPLHNIQEGEGIEKQRNDGLVVDNDNVAVPVVKDDWDVVEDSRPPLLQRSSSSTSNARPKSASATNSFRRRSFVTTEDQSISSIPVPPPPASTGSNLLSYVLVGKAVSIPSINYIDYLCQQFHLITRLQRWWRLKLRHCRYHRFVRERACLRIQCTIRTFLAKCCRINLLNARRSVKIQKRRAKTMLQKRFHYWHLRKHAAILSFHFKKYLLKKRKLEQLQRKCATVIQRWVRKYHRKKLVRNFQRLKFTFVRYKRWLQKKVRLIVTALRVFYRTRIRKTRILQVAVRQYFVKLKLHRAYLKLKLKQLASEAKARLGQVLQLKKERQHFEQEDLQSVALKSLPLFTITTAVEVLEEAEFEQVVMQEEAEDLTMGQDQKGSTVSIEAQEKSSPETTKGLSEEQRSAKRLPRKSHNESPSTTTLLAESKTSEEIKQGPEIISLEEFLARPLEDDNKILPPKEKPGKHMRPSNSDSRVNPLAISWDEEAIQKASMQYANRFVKSNIPVEDHFQYPIPPAANMINNNSQRVFRPYHPNEHHQYNIGGMASPRSQPNTSVLHFPFDDDMNGNHNQADNSLYSAQSLHEVLRERQALFHLRQQQLNLQQLHLQPNAGLDDFFSKTLAQPSPSPVFSPHLSAGEAFHNPITGGNKLRNKATAASTLNGLMSSKSRPTSATSTAGASSKLKTSQTSANNHFSSNSSVGGASLSSAAIYNSGNGTIPSPRVNKKPSRPLSAGATRKTKSEKEAEKKKKDRISAIYLYK